MLSRKKVCKTKWEKVMTTFSEKTTIFRNFGHKMQSGSIFFRTKDIASFCIAIVSPYDVVSSCVFVFPRLFVFLTIFGARNLTYLTTFSSKSMCFNWP